VNSITVSVAGLNTAEAVRHLKRMSFEDYFNIKVIVNEKQSLQTLMKYLPLDKLEGFYTIDEAIDFEESILYLGMQVLSDERTPVQRIIDRCKAMGKTKRTNFIGSKLYSKKD